MYYAYLAWITFGSKATDIAVFITRFHKYNMPNTRCADDGTTISQHCRPLGIYGPRCKCPNKRTPSNVLRPNHNGYDILTRVANSEFNSSHVGSIGVCRRTQVGYRCNLERRCVACFLNKPNATNVIFNSSSVTLTFLLPSETSTVR